MPNFKGVFSVYLLTLVAIAEPFRQVLLTPSQASASTFDAQGAIAQAQLSWQGVMRSIFGGKEPRPPGRGRPGGSRPADLCWLTPNGFLWQTQPLFVWTGNFRAIGVRAANEPTDLWRAVTTTTRGSIHRLQYTGRALEPGKDYEWVFFFDETATSPMLKIPFQVVKGDEHRAIAQDLSALEANLKAQKANRNAIALQRANFFAQRGLQTDALQEMYTVQNPSAALKQSLQEIEKTLCQSQK